MKIRVPLVAAILGMSLALPVPAQQPAPAAPPTTAKPDHITAIKQSLGASMATLRGYEWIETTAVSIKGDEKSKTQNKCYYGADGKLQKVPVGAAPAPAQKRGLRGAVAENKKEDISESMQEAVALVKQYVPPDPDRINAAKADGRLSVVPPDAQGNVKVTIKDYLKVGDSLTLTANAATDRLGGISIATFTDKAKHAVNMTVSMGAFPDGTLFPSQIDLEVKEENLGVAIQNSGYKKVAG